jgi:hypothetical protein
MSCATILLEHLKNPTMRSEETMSNRLPVSDQEHINKHFHFAFWIQNLVENARPKLPRTGHMGGVGPGHNGRSGGFVNSKGGQLPDREDRGRLQTPT